MRHVRLVFFSRFCFISPFLFLLSRVPHFLSFPPPDLEQRRRRPLGLRRRRDPSPPHPLFLFLSFPIHLFFPHSLFLTRLGFLAAAAGSICAHRSSPLAGEVAQTRPRGWGWRGSHESDDGGGQLRP